MNQKNTFSPAEIEARYSRGLSIQEIADEAGVSKQRIHQIMDRHHIKRREVRGPRRKEIDVDLVRALRGEGKTWAEVGEVIGVHAVTLATRLETKEFPRPRRPRWFCKVHGQQTEDDFYVVGQKVPRCAKCQNDAKRAYKEKLRGRQ